LRARCHKLLSVCSFQSDSKHYLRLEGAPYTKLQKQKSALKQAFHKLEFNDELCLVKFTEEFLDLITHQCYSDELDYTHEIVRLFEIDRICF